MVIKKTEASGVSLVDFFKRCLVHPDEQIRREAVTGTAKAIGNQTEDLLAPLLQDKDEEVVRRVAVNLGETGVNFPESVQFFLDVVAREIKAGEVLFGQVLKALVKMDLKPFKETPLAASLNKLVEERSFFGLGKKSSLSPDLKLDVVRILGEAGDYESTRILEKMIKLA